MEKQVLNDLGEIVEAFKLNIDRIASERLSEIRSQIDEELKSRADK